MSKQIYNISEIPYFNEIINSKTQNILNSRILKINKKNCKINHLQYTVISYDKNILSFDLISSYGLCRSIVLNSNNKVVCFAPPKSYNADYFINKYPEKTQEIQAEEFIEGTMINVFFDPSVGISGSWEISTRNTVGGTSGFFKYPNSKTFRQMFMEATSECNLDINKLQKDLCYSFVLQHPENRIVVPFSKPELYLVGVYKINNNSDKTTIDFFNCHEYQNYFSELGSTVKFPVIYQFYKYTELIDKYGSMNTPYKIVGVIIHNKLTGERTKIRNPVYEQVRNLRGNQPKLQYQYLSLRKEGNVTDFLKFYPEHKKHFSAFRDQVHLFTHTLYSNYVSCYIKKEKPLIDFSPKFRTHMFNIHRLYINELKDKKLFVNNSFVQSYVNELHPALLMYCLNYELRKRNNDIVASCKI